MARKSSKKPKPKRRDVPLLVPWAELMPPANISIGASLMDTIDDLINEGHIEPQLAMKILGNFDRIVQEVLADKVKTRLTFKVGLNLMAWLQEGGQEIPWRGKSLKFELYRAILIPTDSATRSGHSY
jgi:Transcription initiation factor IIA, gamma subunit, helical domain